MSDEFDMPSFRSLANAASRSLKNYVAQREFKRSGTSTEGSSRLQAWGQWAEQKLKQVQGEGSSTESVLLFPGWARRCFHEPPNADLEDAPFDVELFVSGYASRSTGKFDTRAGRAFLKIAVSFAALPKLAAQYGTMSHSSADLLEHTTLPSEPDGMDENAQIEALESRLRNLDIETESMSSSSDTESMLFRSPTSGSFSPTLSASSPSLMPNGSGTAIIQKWRANLESRLLPFWSSTISNRPIRIAVYVSDPAIYGLGDKYKIDHEKEPLMSRALMTGTDGSFQFKFVVPWQSLCTHPEGVQIAFGNRSLEHEMYVVAELMPPPRPGGEVPSSPQTPTAATVQAAILTPLTHTTVRVISDIDDTIKLANVLGGARAIFQTVFVKDLVEAIIPGMAEWYTEMWHRGVRFHYVSNGPFEIFPVINEFFQLSRLPPGSVKLKSYGGRSLFSGLLSAPAARKRAGVIEIMDCFPDARFICVGDSGEQDLECYSSIAKERPHQVLAICIRDVMKTPPLDDSTGEKVYSMEHAFEFTRTSLSTTPRALSRNMDWSAPSPILRTKTDIGSPPKYAVRKPKPRRTYSDNEVIAGHHEADGYFTAKPLNSSPIEEKPEPTFTPQGEGTIIQELETETPTGGTRTYISEAERRRNEYQMRVWRARLETPKHIPLRVFRHPSELVEATRILDEVQGRREDDKLL